MEVNEGLDRAKGGQDGPLPFLNHGHKFISEKICVFMAGLVGTPGQHLWNTFVAPLGHCDFHRHTMGLVGM